MVLVLCDSFEDAQNGFGCFLDFLETYEPFSISKVFEFSYCVETDDDFRYIFIDRRMRKLFYSFDRPDEVELDDFFDGIDKYYFGDEVKFYQ